jgi:hypothetical protein
MFLNLEILPALAHLVDTIKLLPECFIAAC